MKKRGKIIVRCILFLLLIFSGEFFMTQRASASETLEDYFGSYEEKVEGTPGVYVSFNDKKWLLYVDWWKYAGDNYGFHYDGIYIAYGRYGAGVTVYRESDNDFKEHSEKYRLELNTAEMFGGATDYSVVTRRIKEGKEYGSPIVEYTDKGINEELGVSSLCQTVCKTLNCCAKATSYEYHVYTSKPINTASEIKMSTQGGKLENEGKGYYIESGYRIAKLPTASYVKTGYQVDFLGWYTKPEGGKLIKEDDIIATDEGVYAHWKFTPLLYDVSVIDICNSTEQEIRLGETTIQKEYDSTVSGDCIGADKNEDVYYKGYHLSSASSKKMALKDNVLYRYFEPNTYQITFQGNGATQGTMNVVSYKYGVSQRLPKNIFQRRHTLLLSGLGEDGSKTEKVTVSKQFLGWALEENGIVELADEDSIDKIMKVGKDVVLYGVWEDEKKYIDYVPARAGYEFLGWSADRESTAGEKSFNVVQDTTFYAVWKGESTKYSIEYYKENQEGNYEYITKIEKNAVSGKEVTADLWEDVYSGYAANLEKSTIKGVVTSDGTLTLKVYLRKTKRTLTFEYSQADNAKDYALAPVEMKVDDVIVLPDILLSKQGYQFTGWSLDSFGKELYKPGEKMAALAQDTTVYAVFVPNTYRISFASNDAQEGDKMSDLEMQYDEAKAAPECSYQKKGYCFAGWNTKADGSGRSIKAGDMIKNLTAQQEEYITLYAQWKASVISVRYDKNNAQMTAAVSGNVENTQYFMGQDSYAATQSYLAAGYSMLGWNTKADGSGTYVNLGEKINGLFEEETEGVLYAVWKADGDVAFQINLTDCATAKSIKIITLYGKAGQKVSDVIKSVYAKRLETTDINYFYDGYEVVNPVLLEEEIRADAGTLLTLLVKKVDYVVEISVNGNLGTLEKISENSDELRLPETLSDGTSVARYTDENGNVYYPGDTIVPTQDMVLQPEKMIVLQTGSQGEKLSTDFVAYGEDYVLPDASKEGHTFLGWYSEDGTFAGNAGDKISNVKDNKMIVAKWSEPLQYQITYDFQNQNITILENKVDSYTYGTQTLLPKKSQLLIPEGIEFLGWHIAGTNQEDIIEWISSDTSGDICLEAICKVVSDKKEDVNYPTYSEPGSQTSESEKTDTSESTTGKKCSFWVGNCKYKITDNGTSKYAVLVKVKNGKKKLNIPKTVTWQGEKYTVKKIGKKSASGIGSIVQITIPDTVTCIQKSAFSNMKNLKKVKIGTGVVTIQKNAFKNCKKLSKISLAGRKIKNIESKAFGTNKKCRIVTSKSVKSKYKKMVQKSKSKGIVCC